MKPKRIGIFQLCSLFFVSRSLGLFTFIAPERNELTSGETVVLFIPFLLLEALFSIPVFYIIRRYETLPNLTHSFSKPLTYGVGIYYFLGLSLSTAVSLARFELFMSTVLYPDAQLTFFVLLLLSAGVFIAFGGIEATARASTVVFVFTAVSILFIMGATVGDFQWLNFTPPLTNGLENILTNGLLSASRTTELVTLFFLSPQIKNVTRKDYLVWATVFAILSTVILGFIAGVTGAYGEKQVFRLYTLTEIARFGVFERLDALLTGVWVLCSLFRTAFYLYAANTCLNQCFAPKYTRIGLPLSGAVAFGLYLFLSADTVSFSSFLQSGITQGLFIVGAVVLPGALIIIKPAVISLRKRKKE